MTLHHTSPPLQPYFNFPPNSTAPYRDLDLALWVPFPTSNGWNLLNKKKKTFCSGKLAMWHRRRRSRVFASLCSIKCVQREIWILERDPFIRDKDLQARPIYTHTSEKRSRVVALLIKSLLCSMKSVKREIWTWERDACIRGKCENTYFDIFWLNTYFD